MKLSQWAKKHGLTYDAVYRMFRKGQLPVPATQLPTGTILVEDPAPAVQQCAIYARVSGADQKADLDRQVARLTCYALDQKLPLVSVVKEIGSGLNGHRKGLIALLKDTAIQTILIEHSDRLSRFGFEYIEATLQGQGRKILVMDPTELQDDIVKDVHDILVSLCARLYGKRSAKNKARKALQAMEQ